MRKYFFISWWVTMAAIFILIIHSIIVPYDIFTKSDIIIQGACMITILHGAIAFAVIIAMWDEKMDA